MNSINNSQIGSGSPLIVDHAHSWVDGKFLPFCEGNNCYAVLLDNMPQLVEEHKYIENCEADGRV